MSELTRILSQVEQGNPQAAEELLPLVYDELRKLAAARLAQEKPGQTLQATALVHEAWLRLVKPGGGSQESGVGEMQKYRVPNPDPRSPTPSFHSRTHFFAAAAEAMRRILVDCARRKAAVKRGHAPNRINVEQAAPELFAVQRPAEVLAVHEALDALAAEDSLAAELVKLHYFGGFALEEAGELLGLSRATAYRTWTYARTWLRAALTDVA